MECPHLEHAPGLLVDQAGDALHAATARQAADGRLGDALDVVAQNLPVALGAALSKTLQMRADRLEDVTQLCEPATTRVAPFPSTRLTLPPLPRPDMLAL